MSLAIRRDWETGTAARHAGQHRRRIRRSLYGAAHSLPGLGWSSTILANTRMSVMANRAYKARAAPWLAAWQSIYEVSDAIMTIYRCRAQAATA